MELGGDTRVPELRGGAGPVTQPVQAAEGQLTYLLSTYLHIYTLTVSTYLHSLYLELVSLHLGRISLCFLYYTVCLFFFGFSQGAVNQLF